ncbi:MAG: type II toxin-antitoxin system RelE/ParE family toxin [Acidobacteria bacterium]|nr:type II toxin-antitoxin system RelE/ParE family toxin [Acidobacteriota bacterium]
MRKLSVDARRKAGHELFLVQTGLEPSDFRPMPSVGPGVVEIRVHTRLEHRVFYVAKFFESVYVLHVFRKTTRATEKRDIDVGARRLQDVMRGRKTRGG